MLNRKRLATPLGGKEMYGGLWREELFGGISEHYSTPDPFTRARYLEKLKLLGLNESGDPCDMENGSNLGENMT